MIEFRLQFFYFPAIRENAYIYIGLSQSFLFIKWKRFLDSNWKLLTILSPQIQYQEFYWPATEDSSHPWVNAEVIFIHLIKKWFWLSAPYTCVIKIVPFVFNKIYQSSSLQNVLCGKTSNLNCDAIRLLMLNCLHFQLRLHSNFFLHDLRLFLAKLD